jgi:hypothetical protein
VQPQSPGYYVELSRRGGDLGQSSQMQINRPCLKSKGGYGLGACMSTVVHQTLHRMRYEGVQSVGQHNRTSTHLAQVILQAPSHHPCLRTPDITEFAVPRQLKIPTARRRILTTSRTTTTTTPAPPTTLTTTAELHLNDDSGAGFNSFSVNKSYSAFLQSTRGTPPIVMIAVYR